ncbi:glycosyltransferase family 87 protein [Streptomyces sp. NPDC007100]|uniref:glycosyltransferase family 87 protein n=1 Tax=Streptomyces sp. NPDC007100 TaxID=3155602 RepID=UPI0033E86BBC
MSAEKTGITGAGEAAGSPAAGSPAAGSPAVGWLLGRAPWPLWAAASALMAAVVFHVHRHSPTVGMDNDFVVKAARALLGGDAPYADKRFLYLPSAVLAAVPEALLPAGALRLLVPVAGVGLVLLGWLVSLRIFRIPVRSRLAVLGVAALAFFEPFRNVVNIGNWTLASVVALPLMLLLALRSRWVAAGAVLGLALALKPLLAPLLLLLVLARRWRALAVAVAVPAGASVLAALVMPRPGMFFTRTLPFLLHGQDSFARPFDASPGMILTRLGVPETAAYGAAAVAAVAGAGCAWLRWRRGDEGALRLVETAAMLMLAAFLVSRPSFDHYLLVALPPLAASVVLPGSVPRSVWFWVALVPQVGGLPWPHLEGLHRRAFKDTAMLCTVAVVLAWTCVRPRVREVVAIMPRGPEGTDRTPVRDVF